MKSWEGTHLYIWQLDKTWYGDPDSIIKAAKALGITGVVVKFANGSLAGDSVSQGYMNNFLKICGPLKRAGLRVGGWIYQYLTDVQGEVDACVQAYSAGADYIILDAEIDVKGKESQVEQFGKLLRQALPSVPVGLSSFAIAQYHPEVPFNLYNQFVDFMVPQIYWSEMGWDISVAFNASVASYKGFGKPIAPTGQSYNKAIPSDMSKFVQLCQQAKFTGISWWDWQEASQDQLNAISANILQPPVDPPVTSPDGAGTPPWYAKAAAYVQDEGIMESDGNLGFNPDGPVTRAQMAQAIYNMRHQSK